MSEIIPVLELGKARAKEAFLAGSGRVINPSRYADTRQVRYRMGRHRGKTPDQVDAEFERLWGGVHPSIREKYAKMAGPQTGSGYGAKVEKPEMKKVPLAPEKRPAAKPAAATYSFEQITDPNQKFEAVGTDLNKDGKVNDADAEANAAAVKKPKPFGKGDFGYSFKDDVQSAVNAFHGRGFKPNDAPAANPAAAAAPAVPAATAPAVQKPGAFAGAQRRGGTSPSGQQGRISSGASPSAPPAVRDAAADVADKPWANVAGQPPQTPVPRPMPDQKPAGTVAERARPAMGRTPAGMELVGMKGSVPQYAPIGEVYGDRAKTQTPMLPKTDEQIRGSYQRDMQKTVAKPYARYGATPQATVPQGPASQPAPSYQSPTEKGGAFSREAYARTAAAQQTGIEREAIRKGTASEETRAKHADYVAKMEADRKMFPAAKPVSTFPASKPRFAMAR